MPAEIESVSHRMTFVSKIPLKAFQYANLAIGLLVILTNGAAIALVLAGRGGTVSDRVLEMTLWLGGGVLLAAGALYGFLRGAGTAVLRIQLFVVLALVAGIAVRALVALTRASAVDAQLVWGLGFFSLLVVYAVGLIWRVYEEDRYKWARVLSLWVAIPIAVLLDLAMAFRG